MLAELTPAQLAEWRVAVDFLGLDDQWEQASVVCQELHTVVASFAGNNDDPPPRKRFQPHRLSFKKPTEGGGKYLTVEEMKARAKRRANL